MQADTGPHSLISRTSSHTHVAFMFLDPVLVMYRTNAQITRILSREEIKIAKMDHRFPSGNALSAYTNWIRHFVPNSLLQKIVTTCLTTVKLLSQKSQQLRPGSHKGRGQYWLKKIMNHNLGHPIRHNILMIQERGMYMNNYYEGSYPY